MKLNPYRTLILWSCWAFVTIVIYFSLYVDAKVWIFIEDDPSKITWIIMFLFVLAFFGSLLVTLTITKEGIQLMLLGEYAKSGGLQKIMESSKSEKRVVFRFFKAIHTTLSADGHPDVELLANVELAVLQRISHAIDFVGNILITLGLIGTVMGLTMTLTGLTNALDSLGHDQSMLMQGLQKAMGGMGTAFYTTLLGAVLGGVVLRVFGKIIENGVNSLYDMLMGICLVYCSADYKPSLSREARILNKEMRDLESSIGQIAVAFNASRIAMNEFRDDLKIFSEKTEGEGEHTSLQEVIKRHVYYCEILREEVRLIQAANNSWWARLKLLFNIRP
ncbi:MAG: MotA/TolQ/ExbB proton channel family protein [Thiohalomonadales bacterium]